ncbi:uncharacterized protein YoxC [Paenibacillus phyllosphaerae]|uniref:Uncharacterized protein YoxC n=1 Tax=Paenibacillus phyllosphaerae TaxID=274593 RepID=A0A7W5AW21_9BACL|nr:DUF948 domain-containing protein [Paenibacillus phyllosphaerae]MBB3109835.1 uncharacterized protein YoxC [Paenibacillus phyllosphaerae]
MMNVWLQAAGVAAFIALVVGVLLWLRAADRKLAMLTESAKAMQQSASEMAEKISGLAEPAAETVRIVQRQVDGASRLFDAARRMGESADQASTAVQKLTRVFTSQAQAQVERGGGKYKLQIKEALDWAEVGYAAWQFVQSKRKDDRTSECCQYENGHDTKE